VGTACQGSERSASGIDSGPGNRRKHRIRFRPLLAAGSVILASLPILVTGSNGSAAAAPGITSTTIRVGLPYLDLSALHAVGLNLDQGSYPDAFKALIDQINSHGGINGRKIALSLATVNPVSTASSASACTQLTQDDHVFAVFGPLYPLCYQQAGVVTFNGDMGATLSPNAAANFTLTPPSAAFDPVQVAVFAKEGILKGKKVGVISASVDKSEVPVVLAALRKQHVDVAQTAVDSAPQNDTAASNQQIQTISQRFQNDGVNVVVGVGTGSAGWLTGLIGNQSSYHPRIVATSYSDFAGTISAKGGNNPTYLKDAVTATPIPSQKVFWNDPAVQKCVHTIKKAYPSTAIGNPIGAAPNAPTTWVAAENTCQDVAMFAAIAKAAGRNLTIQSFEKAGYGLHSVSIPGMGGPVSFGPNRPYALGPVYLVNYDAKSQQMVIASKPAN
jgi:ABC-type branched-subunit amino acid transport system substrate-binding protein